MYVNYYDHNKNDGVVKFTLPESNKSIIVSQYLPTEQQLLGEVNKELANFEEDKKEI
jgi:hypothetical protein